MNTTAQVWTSDSDKNPTIKKVNDGFCPANTSVLNHYEALNINDFDVLLFCYNLDILN